LATVCGQPHEVIGIDREFLVKFPELAQRAVYLSDGACDVTTAIDLYVQDRAVAAAPVRITGTNGGEILRRLIAFKPSRLAGKVLAPDLAGSLGTAESTYEKELRGNRLTFTAFKQSPWYMAPKFVLERTRLQLRMPYFDNELVSLAYRAPQEGLENSLSLRLAIDGNPMLANVKTDRSGARGTPRLLRKVRSLVDEFAFKADYAYDSGMPQWLATADHALAPLRLDRFMLGRHKFHHFRVFYRDELAGFVRDILLDRRTASRPYFEWKNVERAVIGHTEGSANYTREIHKLLSIELLTRQLIEQN
jgi:asparagine synthase (glutamine-hydrolysing)